MRLSNWNSVGQAQGFVSPNTGKPHTRLIILILLNCSMNLFINDIVCNLSLYRYISDANHAKGLNNPQDPKEFGK